MPTTFPAIPTLATQSFMHRLWFDSPANTELGRSTDNLYMFILWTCVISFTIVIGLAYYFAWKYRRRPGVPTQRSPSHNTPLELMWSIVPLLVMVVIFFWGFHGYIGNMAAPGNAEVIRIVGQQWNWTATYDNGRELGPDDFTTVERDGMKAGNKSSPIITVPAGRPIKFLMSSRDVIHSFYIPDMRVKLDVFPNRYTSYWIQPLEAGKDHIIFCAEYCGQDHSEMNAILRVVSPEDYLEHKNKEVVIEDPVEYGRYLYRAKGCIACHSIDGAANTGPTWQGLWGSTNHQFADAPPMDLTDPETFYNYIRESVFEPKAKLVEGYGPQMNSYQGLITEEQLEGIIAFMMSPEVSGRAAPAPAPAGGPEGEQPAEPAPSEPAPSQAPESGSH